ncbi:MAG: 3-methyl-2-oxobutanoate dehydrogenase subunit beta [Oscillospiraceae bacterium]|nr:3-methyl-2-oxobutanoate dehydrogenase subunit beta [Oscillospiraceae bacterium]
MAKVMMKGNVAAAEAAIRGGMEFFAGYPITPSTETLETLSSRMPEEGRVFIQAENEIASINMVLGAAACGARAFTTSSGPGMALKQEGFSYAARMELPYVVMNVQRWGVGLGMLDSGQVDYLRDTRAGGNGDYRHIVYAPDSVQELVDDVYEAFDVSQKYRMGVLILSEGYLGQMMESVELPPYKEITHPDWGLDGTGEVGLKQMCPCYNVALAHQLLPQRQERINRVCREMQRWENISVEDAEYVFVAFGLPARVCADAVYQLRAEGHKVGLIRPKLVFPYPFDAFKQVNPQVKAFISVETNDLGQMVQDVALAAKREFPQRNVPVYCYTHSVGVPRVQAVVDYYRSVCNGSVREVY